MVKEFIIKHLKLNTYPDNDVYFLIRQFYNYEEIIQIMENELPRRLFSFMFDATKNYLSNRNNSMMITFESKIKIGTRVKILTKKGWFVVKALEGGRKYIRVQGLNEAFKRTQLLTYTNKKETKKSAGG